MVLIQLSSLVSEVSHGQAFLGLCSLLISLIVLLLIRQLVKQRRPLGFPPGPSPIPVIGNIMSLATEPHVFMKKQSEIHGQVRYLPYCVKVAWLNLGIFCVGYLCAPPYRLVFLCSNRFNSCGLAYWVLIYEFGFLHNNICILYSAFHYKQNLSRFHFIREKTEWNKVCR